jgi:hypothetical protein
VGVRGDVEEKEEEGDKEEDVEVNEELEEERDDCEEVGLVDASYITG